MKSSSVRYSKLRFAVIAFCIIFVIFITNPNLSGPDAKAGIMFLWVITWLSYNIQLGLTIKYLRGSVLAWVVPSLLVTLPVPPLALISFFLARKKLFQGAAHG